MNRKIVVSAAVSVLALSLMASCSSGTSSTAGGSGGKTYKIAFVEGVTGNPFYITMQCGVQAAAKAEGATVTTQGPQKFDPALQTPILESVVASKPDAILIAPTDVSSMQRPIARAAEQGIKVVLVDTTLNDPSVAVSAISSDNYGGGKAAFESIKKLAPEGGEVLGVCNQPGISTTDARDKGFADAAKADPSFTYLGVQYPQNDPARAASIVSAALQKNPGIVGIFASNRVAAEGTATGVRQAGMQNKVKITGFDAGPNQVKALEEGTVQALIAQQPARIGTDGVEQAIKAIKGEATTASIRTGFTIITQSNLNSAAGRAAVYKTSC